MKLLSLKEIKYQLDDLIKIESNLHKVFGDNYDVDFWDLDNFLLDLPLKQELTKIIIIEDRIIGFSVAYMFKNGWAHISRVGLEPNWQGTEMGTKLLQYQLADFKKYNIDICTIDYKKRNFKIGKLYKKLGFKEFKFEALKKYVLIRERKYKEYLTENSEYNALYKNISEQMNNNELVQYYFYV